MTKPKQAELFSFAEAKRRKEDGMKIAANANEDGLLIARNIAVQIALKHPNQECDADKVMQMLWDRYGISSIGNAAGSIFREAHWEFTGRMVQTTKKTNHGRRVMVWRLV